jgi:hypothetical protein
LSLVDLTAARLGSPSSRFLHVLEIVVVFTRRLILNAVAFCVTRRNGREQTMILFHGGWALAYTQCKRMIIETNEAQRGSCGSPFIPGGRTGHAATAAAAGPSRPRRPCLAHTEQNVEETRATNSRWAWDYPKKCLRPSAIRDYELELLRPVGCGQRERRGAEWTSIARAPDRWWDDGAVGWPPRDDVIPVDGDRRRVVRARKVTRVVECA